MAGCGPPQRKGMRDFKSVGKVVGGNEGTKCHYPYRLDTYGCGCLHDCKYCYAKSLLEFRGLWDAEHPAVASISDISREIRKLKPGQVVRLGGMTDCFQPIEKLYRNTYKTIRLLNRRKVHYLIVTKSAMVADYMDILDKKLAHIQITTTGLDEYERASPTEDRLRAVRTLQNGGYDVSVRISPFIPQIALELNFDGIDKAVVEFLRVNAWIKKWFDIDYSEYTVSHGGYWHMPLRKKVEYIKRLEGFKEMTVCEDEDGAYEYWKHYFNHNPDDCCNLRI